MTRKPKNSATARRHRRQLDRARPVTHPLIDAPPPFRHYKEPVIQVSNEFAEHPAYPFPHSALEEMREHLGDEADLLTWFMDTLVRLGPLYDGAVPQAAMVLEDLIRNDRVLVMQFDGERVAHVQAEAVIREMQNPSDEHRTTAEEFGIDMDELIPPSEESLSPTLHRLHHYGILVLDDDCLLRPAIPPKKRRDQWQICGHESTAA